MLPLGRLPARVLWQAVLMAHQQLAGMVLGSPGLDLEPEITEVFLAWAVMDLAHGFMWAGLDPGSVGADKALVTTGLYLETRFTEASLVSGSTGALVCRSWPGTWSHWGQLGGCFYKGREPFCSIQALKGLDNAYPHLVKVILVCRFKTSFLGTAT